MKRLRESTGLCMHTNAIFHLDLIVDIVGKIRDVQ